MIHGLKKMQIKAGNRNLAPQTVFYFCECLCVCRREGICECTFFCSQLYFIYIHLEKTFLFSNAVKCTNQVLLKAAVDKRFSFWKMEKLTVLFRMYDNKVLIISGLCMMERLQTLSCVCLQCS